MVVLAIPVLLLRFVSDVVVVPVAVLVSTVPLAMAASLVETTTVPVAVRLGGDGAEIECHLVAGTDHVGALAGPGVLERRRRRQCIGHDHVLGGLGPAVDSRDGPGEALPCPDCRRSALGDDQIGLVFTVVVAVAELLAGVGSVVAEETFAVLVTSVPSAVAGFTRTTRVKAEGGDARQPAWRASR